MYLRKRYLRTLTEASELRPNASADTCFTFNVPKLISRALSCQKKSLKALDRLELDLYVTRASVYRNCPCPTLLVPSLAGPVN